MKGKKWNDKITGKKIEIKDRGIDRVNETHTHTYIYIYIYIYIYMFVCIYIYLLKKD